MITVPILINITAPILISITGGLLTVIGAVIGVLYSLVVSRIKKQEADHEKEVIRREDVTKELRLELEGKILAAQKDGRSELDDLKNGHKDMVKDVTKITNLLSEVSVRVKSFAEIVDRLDTRMVQFEKERPEQNALINKALENSDRALRILEKDN